MPIYILDTDTLTLLRANHADVCGRVAAVAPTDIAVTAITVDEVLTGWYAVARRANRPDLIERAYGELAQAVLFLGRQNLLNFTRPAIAEYDRLKALKLNVGRNDMRIGAIALELRAVVVTRNVRDFGRIPNLTVEDWSAPPPAPPTPTAATGS